MGEVSQAAEFAEHANVSDAPSCRDIDALAAPSEEAFAFPEAHEHATRHTFMHCGRYLAGNPRLYDGGLFQERKNTTSYMSDIELFK